MGTTTQDILEECDKVRHDLHERRAIVGLAAANTVEETLIVLLAEIVVRLGRIELQLKTLPTSVD